MPVYKVVSKNGRSYTIGTDNILGVTRTIACVGEFPPDDIVKIVEVEERDGVWHEVTTDESNMHT